MATSAELLQQIQAMNQQPMPDFKSQIADLYNQPVLQPLVKESADLEAQYLPTIFNALQGGTGAGDMSPAARLSHIGGMLGRQGARVGANRQTQNFYNTQIQDLAGLEAQRYGQKQQNLQNLYQTQWQREMSDRDEAFRQQQLARSGGGGGGGRAEAPGIDFASILSQLSSQQSEPRRMPNMASPAANPRDTLRAFSDRLRGATPNVSGTRAAPNRFSGATSNVSGIGNTLSNLFKK